MPESEGVPIEADTARAKTARTKTSGPPTQDPELEDLMEEALGYHEKALSENTRRAYRRGWEDFAEFCEEHDFSPVPSTEQAVVLFLTERARSLSPSTLKQRLAAIQHVHDQRDEKSPTRSKAVRNVMRGIRRDLGHAPRQAKPLLTADVKAMVDALPIGPSAAGTGKGPKRLRGLRDRALILIGFAGALRRSELAALQREDVEERSDGLLVTIPESKTDQEGEGQQVAIRRVGGDYCPAGALKTWTEAAGIEEGALFRGVRQSGELRPGAVTGKTVGTVVRGAAEAVGLPDTERITGHSLRAGHITQASKAGVPDGLIQAHSRHKSDRAFREYVRPQKLLEDTSSAHLGL
jgi:integrase